MSRARDRLSVQVHLTPSHKSMAACIALIAAAGIGACSRHQPAAPAAISAAPAVDTDAAARSVPHEDLVASEIIAGGLHASYRASFVDEQLKRIVESRDSAPNAGNGEYEFQGARLMKYAGAAPSGSGPIEIRFSLQGAVIMSRAAAGKVTDDEIGVVRTRAQLLRSHALAQRATRAHRAW